MDGAEPTRTAPTDAELERVITSVPGVAEASLTRLPESGRGRLRLRLVPGENTEVVAWAVAATLRERFGISLDPQAIRPVEAESEVADGVVAATPEQDPIRLVEDGPDDRTATARTELSRAAEAALAGLGGERPRPSPRNGEPDAPRAPGIDDTLWRSSGVVPEDAPSGAVQRDAGAQAHVPSAAEDASGQPAPPPPAQEQQHQEEEDVAPRAPDSAPVRSLDDVGRLIIHHLDTKRDADDLRVTATLRHGGRVAHGESQAVPTTLGVFRAVAEATLSAVRASCSGTLLVGVDRVSVQLTATPPTATVVLSLLTRAGEETLVGASLVRADAEWAVMRATLDALNRRLTPLLELPA